MQSGGCLRTTQTTAGLIPTGQSAIYTACQGVPDQAMPGQAACRVLPTAPVLSWDKKSEMDADCPTAGQPALELALSPGIGQPRKS